MSLNNSKNSILSSNDEISQPPGDIFHSAYGQRSWLKSRGKEEYIAFSEKALIELRKYFNSLDQNNNGSIGVEELEDPFIAFGLSDSREEVEELILSVDLDGSGKIEFDEFLEIMSKIKRGNSGGSKNSAMFDFFQRMSTGQLGEEFDKDMSFKLNVSQFRRRKLLEAMMADSKQKKEKGSRILQNFKKQIMNNPNLKETLNESKKGSAFMYGLDAKGKKTK